MATSGLADNELPPDFVVIDVVAIIDADEEGGSVETEAELEEDTEEALKVDVDEVAGEEDTLGFAVEEAVSIK